MTYTKLSAKLALFTAVSALTHAALPQAAPAGTQKLQLSAFVAATGTFTGLEGGKNLGITAGADLTFLGFRRFRPAFEARGTYPINKGHIREPPSPATMPIFTWVSAILAVSTM